MISGGYTGKILRVNLTDKSYREEKLSEEVAKNYLGGAGFGLKYLFTEVPGGTGALDEGNKLIFAPGPLTGTKAPCASRVAVAAKSPLTGGAGVALSGGFFPAELKFAGYDILIIEGKSVEPVYVYINGTNVSFRSAKHLWGMKTSDCQRVIKDELHDQNIRIACIGPAGEKLSYMAAIINERHAAGRKGLGAVMGSKNLKAIAVRGNAEIAIADEKAFSEARRRMLQAMKESPVVYPEFSKHGTPMTVDVTGGLGIFPAANWSRTGEWIPFEALGIEGNNKRKSGREFCYGCPVGCSQNKLVREGEYAGYLSIPEFETIYSFGGETGVDNLDSVIAADYLCDELGLDSISTGVAIGFAMELFERGILTEKDTDGMELKFGNHRAMVEMVKKIAFRQGFGDVLADGTRIAAARIGKDSEKYCMHIKGLEMPGYDVRGAKAHGLSFATAYTGADHNRGYAFQEIFGVPVPYPVDRFAIEGKGKLTKWNQDMRAATCDSPLMCAFLLDMAVPGFAAENTADLVSSATGLKFTPEEVYQIGERINNLARVFNIREGLRRKDDTLPERLMTEPLKGGNSKGQYIPKNDLDQMLDEYYAERGWNKEGIPTRRKLESLGLNECIDTLEKIGGLKID
ncbi:MAG: aldehyde ferredoxin oxidoreductase family protein [Tepidanaerobacteraceae bacterium]|jgi:aldehyde:ferredoxin oxidoreductase|nr:aldehyde ferredoxin oxidoreductase family protein [Tepidanaerobacteraceae bacterium]